MGRRAPGRRRSDHRPVAAGQPGEQRERDSQRRCDREGAVRMTDMVGLVVIVTGAARGVGKGIATALTARGASVLLVDHDAELLGTTATELTGGSVASAVVDLRD